MPVVRREAWTKEQGVMNKILFAGVVAAVTLIGISSMDSRAEAPSSEDYTEVRAEFSKHFPNFELESIKPGPMPGILEIRRGTLVAYLSDDGRYLFQGELIDLESNVNLTDRAASATRADMVAKADEKTMVIFGPDEPQYSVAVFTDIDCGFCRKLHQQIGEYAAEGIEIRYMLYPRSGPGSESWSKAEDVMCAKNQNEAMTMAKSDQPVDSVSCALARTVGDSYQLGSDIGLRGTPAIVTEDGTLISGYLPPKELKRRLESAAVPN